jgi:aspartate ammonia-lyase
VAANEASAACSPASGGSGRSGRSGETRIERDSLGTIDVPASAYWGVHTQRAVGNFSLSGRRVDPGLVRAYAVVKWAACLANLELGYLDSGTGRAIASAAGEVASGGLADQFPVDALAGGAGTSVNMNLNEVIANRANEILGFPLGSYDPVRPIEEVNLHQSTNDTYPTALKLAAVRGLRGLSEKAASLQGAFQAKEKEFSSIASMGRTELQPAVPMTLGQEFSGFAEAIGRDRWRTFKCEERLRVVNLGGTAVGTGIAAPRSYIFLVTDRLRELTGVGFSRGENLVDQTANADCFVEVSGILKAHASNLVKVCGDLRLLNLLGEVRLPAVQTGSSIMPGKANPVIAEAAMQAGMRVMANDALVADACSRGSLQLCEFLPVVALALLESISLLDGADSMLASHLSGITADEAACAAYLDRDPMIATALLPFVGYHGAEKLVEDFKKSGETDMRAFIARELGDDVAERALSPAALSSLGYKDGT